MKKTGSHNPTCWQAQTLRFFVEGWELVIAAWHPDDTYYDVNKIRKPKATERIYWRKYNPKLRRSMLCEPTTWETIECESSARKRHHMSHMERYEWVIKSDSDWIITDKGRAAYKRHIEYFKDYERKRSS